MPIVEDILEFFFERETLHQKYMLSSFQSNIIHPGGEEQQLHVDSSLSNPLPPWPIRLNINFLLTNWTKENGATIVYPKSHKYNTTPSEEIRKEKI